MGSGGKIADIFLFLFVPKSMSNLTNAGSLDLIEEIQKGVEYDYHCTTTNYNTIVLILRL